MILLAIAVGALLIGPLLAKLFERQPGINRFVDGFILVSIGGIAVTHLLPEAVVEIGGMALLMVVIGALLPYFAERAFHAYERATHTGVLILAFSGILVHTMLDGMALSKGSMEHGAGKALALAVILHRLPVGLLIWWALKPVGGTKAILAVLGLMSLSTIAGSLLGGMDLGMGHTSWVTYFQSLVTGSLIHVLFHRHLHSGDHQHDGHGHEPSRRGHSAVPAATGAIFGAALLAFLPLGGSLPHDHSLGSTAHLTVTLFIESSPALLLGFVIAASLQNFIPGAGIAWLSSSSRASRVTKGMLFGLPLPICSCGVVPLYHSMIRRGAPIGAGMAFLIATPELGVDAILISIPLLGFKMTLARLLAAAFIAWFTGYIMDLIMKDQVPKVEPPFAVGTIDVQKNGWKRFWGTLNHELIDHLGPWVLLGLVIAAIADPFLSDVDWAAFPTGWDIPLMALIGMPLYVCATGATPIAAVMLLNGVSPGAVLAFLITGPATNITTIGVMRKLHGTKIAVIFPLVIIALTVVVGLAVNALYGEPVALDYSETHLDEHSLLNLFAACVLLALFIGSLFRIGPRGMLENLYEGLGSAEEDSCGCEDGCH